MWGEDRKDLGIIFTIQELRALENVLKELPYPKFFRNAWWQIINKKDFDVMTGQTGDTPQERKIKLTK